MRNVEEGFWGTVYEVKCRRKQNKSEKWKIAFSGITWQRCDSIRCEGKWSMRKSYICLFYSQHLHCSILLLVDDIPCKIPDTILSSSTRRSSRKRRSRKSIWGKKKKIKIIDFHLPAVSCWLEGIFFRLMFLLKLRNDVYMSTAWNLLTLHRFFMYE